MESLLFIISAIIIERVIFFSIKELRGNRNMAVFTCSVEGVYLYIYRFESWAIVTVVVAPMSLTLGATDTEFLG